MAFASGSPMGSQLDIGIALVLQDRFSNQAREASSAIRGLHSDAKNAIAANMQAANNMANVGLAAAGVATAGIVKAVNAAATYTDTLITVKAITEATSQEMDILDTTAKRLGLNTMFNAQEIASGMQYLAMAGASAKEANEMIGAAAYAANATGIALGGKGGTADMLTNIMRAFGIEGARAAETVADMLTRGTLRSNISMHDLAESIRYVAADARMLNVELPQLIALIGTLGNAGIQGSMAGTALSNMMRYMMKSATSPGYKGASALQALGISRADITDAKGELLDFSTIIEQLQKAMQGKDMQSLDRAGVFGDIFGVRGNRAVQAIVSGLTQYRNLLGEITHNSEGFAKAMTAERMSAMKGILDRMLESFSNFFISFGTSVWPVIEPLITGVTWLMNGLRTIMETPFLGPLLGGLFTATTAFVGLASIVVKLRTRMILMHNDSQVTGRNMFAILLGGWKASTMAAQQYLMTEAAILSQRKAGITGTVLGATAGAYMFNGRNVEAKMGKGGRWFAKTGQGLTGWSRVGANAVQTATGASVLKNVLGKGAGKAALGFGAKGLLGALGGPWTLAIMGISSLLPVVINAIKNNRQSNQENTTSINNLANEVRAERELRNQESEVQRMQRLVEENRALINALHHWAGVIQGNPTTVQIISDGKKTIEKVVDSRETKINMDLGVM